MSDIIIKGIKICLNEFKIFIEETIAKFDSNDLISKIIKPNMSNDKSTIFKSTIYLSEPIHCRIFTINNINNINNNKPIKIATKIPKKIDATFLYINEINNTNKIFFVKTSTENFIKNQSLKVLYN